MPALTPVLPACAARAGARGAGNCRHAFQNGVKTPYGVPAPVRTVHGSYSREPANDATSTPSARSSSLMAASTMRSGPPVPEHRPRADLAGEGGDHLGRGAAAQHEHRSLLTQPLAEFGERVVQPPARGAAERTDAGGDLVEHEDRDHRLAPVGGGAQRRVVGQAQVVAEPDERGGGHGIHRAGMPHTGAPP